jgi:putative Holliday junction resolvase
MSQQTHGDILALDVGSVRIGVARASAIVRLAEPLTTLRNDESVWDELWLLIDAHDAQTIVVGLPRGLDGQETAQTTVVRRFVDELAKRTDLQIALQDEALTSHKAETELANRNKPFTKEAVDALAATYILEDFLAA